MSRLVARNQKGSFLDVVLYFGLCGGLGRGWVLFEKDQKGSEGIARI